MKISAGKLKGRKLKPVPGIKTRPTSDKLRAAIFDVLGQFFDGGSFLDLFSGTGAMAIEAISRGMDHAVCIDIQKLAIQVIKDNVKVLNVEQSIDIYHNDAQRAIKKLLKNKAEFDIIMLDPPYTRNDIFTLAQSLCDSKLVKPGGKVILEYQYQKNTEPTCLSDNVVKYFERRYDDTIIMILEKMPLC